MTNSPASRPDLGSRLVPSLLARDLDETVAFYERLGFARTGSYPQSGPATWTVVQRDGVTLQFHANAPHGTPTEPICSGTFYCYPTTCRRSPTSGAAPCRSRGGRRS